MMRLFGPVLVFLSCLAAPALMQGEDDKTDSKKEKRKPRFTLSKETTHVAGPLDGDGYVDYVAALNERLRRDVTPTNNANVLIWQALGPRFEGGKMPPEFFRRMGIPEPPEKGEYFIDLLRFRRGHLKENVSENDEERNNEISRAVMRPWKAKEYPRIDAWLKANEKPLGRIVEATKRTHYYSPLVLDKETKEPPGLINVRLPGVQQSREIANALAARAMLRLGEERHDDVWQDLLACHRLGRLVGRGPTLIEALVGIAIDMAASKADLAFLAHARLNSLQIKKCLRELRTLPPIPSVADKMDLGERYNMLDMFMIVARGGARALAGLAGHNIPNPPDPDTQRLVESIDWDPALREVNHWYDRLVAALRLKNRKAREKALDHFGEQLKKLKGRVDSGELARAFQDMNATPHARGESLGNIMVCLLFPAFQKVQQASDRSEQTQHNLHLAFALAAYQHDQGRYPESLRELAPKYLAEIPLDLFTGKALHYRTSGKAYLLYSFGVNGQNDDGRSYGDDPLGDDLAVRMPLPELRRKP